MEYSPAAVASSMRFSMASSSGETAVRARCRPLQARSRPWESTGVARRRSSRFPSVVPFHVLVPPPARNGEWRVTRRIYNATKTIFEGLYTPLYLPVKFRVPVPRSTPNVVIL